MGAEDSRILRFRTRLEPRGPAAAVILDDERKELARWVSEAKTEPTRERRVTETLRRLEGGEPPR